MEIFLRLVIMILMVGTGIAARRMRILNETMTARLNAFAFYVSIPALIFISTYDKRPTELASVELILGILIVIAAGVAIAWLIHRRERVDARRSVAIVQSYHSNLGYIGLPLVSMGIGTAAAGRGSVILGIGVLIQIPLTTLLLVRINETTVSMRSELRSVITNPVIVSLIIGLIVASVSWAPSNPVTTGLTYGADLALPVALLCVGASLNVKVADTDFPLIITVVGIKVLLLPAIAFLTFTLLKADSITVATGVVMFGAPTAVSSYIYVGELGGDRSLASTNILATTLVGIATISGLIYLFG